MRSVVAGLLLAAVSGCGSILDGHTSSLKVDQVWLAPFPKPYGWPGLPAVDGGLVLVGVPGGIAAYDAKTGASRWNAALWSSNKFSFAGNIATGGGVACIADYFGVGCVDMASGQVRWSSQDDHPRQGSESAMDVSALYYGTADHSVVARDRMSGRVLWATDVDPGTTNLSTVWGVRVRGDTVFATTVRWLNPRGTAIVGDLIALDRSNGRQFWRYTAPSPSGFQGAPVFVGDLAVLNDTYRPGLVAIDLTSEKEVWHTPLRQDGFIGAETPPALVGDTLFSGSRDTQVYSVDASTGAYRWRVGTRAGSIGTTAVCGRLVLVVPFSGGPLFAVDRTRLITDRVMGLGSDELTGRIAIVGNTAYATGLRGLYALACPGA